MRIVATRTTTNAKYATNGQIIDTPSAAHPS
jgi:hypothetical protein